MRFLRVICAVFCLAQADVALGQDSVLMQIMHRGIAHYDEGNFELALVEYQQALKHEPKNGFVNYEVALAHYQMNNKSKAIEYGKKAFKSNSEHGVQATILLGTIYDEMGEYDESVKAFKKGVKKFGDYYLIWFNLGVTANSAKDFDLAEEAFLKAIENRLDHASSHYGLASVMMRQNRRVEALYPLYFFLLLEPKSERSVMAYEDLSRLTHRGVSYQVGEEGEMNITLHVGEQQKADELMRAADLMLSMLEASKTLEEHSSRTEQEEFEQNTAAIFKFMQELDLGERDDIYSNYYIPFFAAIGESDHIRTFCHFVRQKSNEQSAAWVMENHDQLQTMFQWLEDLNLEESVGQE